MFSASLDRETFEKIDIIQCVGDSIYKDKKNNGNYRVYFDSTKYSAQDETQKDLEVNSEMTIQEQVHRKFKSESYMKLSKDLRDACVQCGFNITQNGNQKFQYKPSGLVVRNRFSCQRYTLYKGTTKEISGSREYRNYTLHNYQLTQRYQGRKNCRRSYSSKSITKENRCNFFLH